MEKGLSIVAVVIAIMAVAIAVVALVNNLQLKKKISDLRTKHKAVEEELKSTVQHFSPQLTSMAKEALNFAKQNSAKGLDIRVIGMKSEGNWGLVTLGAFNNVTEDVRIILKRKDRGWEVQDMGTYFEYKDFKRAPRHWFDKNGGL